MKKIENFIVNKRGYDASIVDKIQELVSAVNKQAEEISFLAEICKRYEDEKDAEFDAKQTQEPESKIRGKNWDDPTPMHEKEIEHFNPMKDENGNEWCKHFSWNRKNREWSFIPLGLNIICSTWNICPIFDCNAHRPPSVHSNAKPSKKDGSK